MMDCRGLFFLTPVGCALKHFQYGGVGGGWPLYAGNNGGQAAVHILIPFAHRFLNQLVDMDDGRLVKQVNLL